MITFSLKVAGVASVSDDFFLLQNMLGYTELNVDTIKNPLEFPEKRQCFHSNVLVRYDVRTSYIRSP